jgi:hypoxanthine phosphoribosyltransferase
LGPADREILTWERFGAASADLARRVADDGFRPDAILAIARGGLPLGGALAYALGVKRVFLMNVEFYTGVDARLPAPVILPPELRMSDLSGARLLVTDDVADTGATLELVRDTCRRAAGEVRTAVLYEKPGSTVRCDYVWCATDRWITFPWSAGDADAPGG